MVLGRYKVTTQCLRNLWARCDNCVPREHCPSAARTLVVPCSFLNALVGPPWVRMPSWRPFFFVCFSSAPQVHWWEIFRMLNSAQNDVDTWNRICFFFSLWECTADNQGYRGDIWGHRNIVRWSACWNVSFIWEVFLYTVAVLATEFSLRETQP